MKQHTINYGVNYLKGYLNTFINRFLSVKSVFRKVYLKRRRQNGETVSGPGSTIEQTKLVVKILSSVVHRYGIRTMLDIPCGDFNWMRHVDLGDASYHGADILDDLIKINEIRFGGDNRTFHAMDLLKDKLPEVDLIFCRDCLVHFSDKHTYLAIANIKRSRAAYLLTTTFPGGKNSDIITGDWRMLNLQSSPFLFPEPLELFNEGYHSGHTLTKSLGLWKIVDLP
jgi:hypothetical protein